MGRDIPINYETIFHTVINIVGCNSQETLLWLNASGSFSADVPVSMHASQQQWNLISKHGPEEEQSFLMFSICILCLLTMYSVFLFINSDYLPWGPTIQKGPHLYTAGDQELQKQTSNPFLQEYSLFCCKLSIVN